MTDHLPVQRRPPTDQRRPAARDAMAVTLGELAQAAVVVDAVTTSGQVDLLFRGDEMLSSVVVTDGSLVRLVSRPLFELAMVGPLGFGRNVWSRRPLSAMGTSPALVLPSETPLGDAAIAILDREELHRYDDVVVTGLDGGLATARVTRVFEQLSAFFAHRSLHDHLTGLPNRPHLAAHAARLVQRDALTAGNSAPGLLYIDLDGFKAVNDQHGHLVGDQVLTGFATRLRGLCRESDVVARLGGDEFAFLLVDPVTPQQAAAIAERVVLTASAPFLIGEDVISVGASVGITLLTEGEPGLERQVDTVEVLLRQADAAMYRAKNSGRGRAEQYRPGLAGPPSALPTCEAGQLRAALDDGLLELHYQPIYNLASGELVKLEALARWRDAHRGYIPPTECIAVAEACGLIHDLGRWALRTACRQAAHWGLQSGADERPPKVAVNVSAHQLIGGSLVDDVLSALEGAGLPADRLCLELTETAAVQDLPSTIRQLSELREAGVHLALDDFGTGYSSLTLIRQLPVHVIKVDRSFIDHIDASTADSVLVRLVVEAAHSLGMTVCAEGVERRGQLTELRAMGCDKVQGYLLATPAGPSTVPLGPCELLDGLARPEAAEPMLPAAH